MYYNNNKVWKNSKIKWNNINCPITGEKKRNKESCLLSTKNHQKGRFSSHSTLPVLCASPSPRPSQPGTLQAPPPPSAARNCFRHSLHYTYSQQRGSVTLKTQQQSARVNVKWPFFRALYLFTKKTKIRLRLFIIEQFSHALFPRRLSDTQPNRKSESERRERAKRAVQLTHTNHDSRVTYNHRVRRVFAQTINKIQKENKRKQY